MNDPKTVTPQSKDEYTYEWKDDYFSDWDLHRQYIQNFDAYEAMFIGEVYDSVSNSVKGGSKITDSYAMTLVKERADRVMAKLPEGQTTPMGQADAGKAAFMDIIRQKWIYPNANSQHPFVEKLNMWQLYSSVYGYMPMFYDWNESSTGYTGPDCWLWNPRNFIPQQGKTSIEDMDYCYALTWVSRRYIKDLIKEIQDDDEDGGHESGWELEALRMLLLQSKKSISQDYDQDTKSSRDRTPQATRKGICLATRYEAGDEGRWTTFAPEHGYVQVRDLKNPHKNGRIPFVVKYSQPMFDSFYGLGDFQRSKSIQFARDGLTNFYFKGIKMNLIPPIIANANGVMKHTLDYREGAVMYETIPNAIRQMPVSNAGLSTYQAAQQALTGSLLSMHGSQNASIPGADALNPSQGKTPQAISLYSDKEATRDGADRRHLEAAIEQLTDAFFSLIVNISTESIPVTLFAEDIEEIVESGMDDVLKLFPGAKFEKDKLTGAAGQLKINPAQLKGVEYRFSISPDSTAKVNKDAQRQALDNWMATVAKMQNVIQQDPTVTVDWPLIFKEYGALSDIPNAGKFIRVDKEKKAEPEPQAPSPTAVTMPGGQVHETADLSTMVVKMMDNPGAIDTVNAILQSMGLPPMQPPAPEAMQPTTTATGHTFNDPAIASAFEALHTSSQQPSTQVTAPEPNITSKGLTFQDPHLAKVADAIHKS